MRIQDVMSKSVVNVTPETKVAVARAQLRSSEIDHLVVLDARRLAGILTGRDLAGEADERTVSEVMTRQVVTIEPEATLRRAAGVMRGRGVSCLPVVDDGRVVGIVTTSDFLTAIAKGETHAGPPQDRVLLRKKSAKKRASVSP